MSLPKVYYVSFLFGAFLKHITHACVNDADAIHRLPYGRLIAHAQTHAWQDHLRILDYIIDCLDFIEHMTSLP